MAYNLFISLSNILVSEAVATHNLSKPNSTQDHGSLINYNLSGDV